MDKEKNEKNYEIGYLARNEHDAAEIKNLLSGYKAVILQDEPAKKIKLAYPIKKELYAHFGFIWFSMDAAMVNEFSKQLKLNSKILRFIVINLTKEMQIDRSTEKKNGRPITGKPKIKSAESPKKQGNFELINNELLEKKLEEILK